MVKKVKAVKVGYVFTLSLLIVLAGVLLITHYYQPPTPPKAPEMPKPDFGDDSYNTPIYDDIAPGNPVTSPVPVIEPITITPPPSFDNGVELSPDSEWGEVTPLQSVSTMQTMPIVGRAQQTFMARPAQALWVGSSQSSDDWEKYDQEMRDYDDKLKAYAKDEFVPYVRTLGIIALVTLAVATIIGLVMAKGGLTTVGSAYAMTGIWGIIFFFPTCFLLTISTAATFLPVDNDASVYYDPIMSGIGWTAAIIAIILTIAGVFLLENTTVKLPSRPKNHSPQPPESPTVI